MRLIEMQVIGAMRPPDGSNKSLSGKVITKVLYVLMWNCQMTSF